MAHNWLNILFIGYIAGIIVTFLMMMTAHCLYNSRVSRSKIDWFWCFKFSLLSWMAAGVAVILLIDTCPKPENKQKDGSKNNKKE